MVNIRLIAGSLAFSAPLFFGPSWAQPADLPIPPATTTTYPAGVAVGKSDKGPAYINGRGQVLYGMDMRILLRWSPNPAQFCQAECAKHWQPLLAPPAATPMVAYPGGFGERRSAPGTTPPPMPAGFVAPQNAPDWTVIEGPQGRQWVYKGWHMVFVRRGEKPGSAAFDGADNLTWNSLKFVPPVPKLVAPSGIVPALVAGKYALADAQGRLLFTAECAADCAKLRPFSGGYASRGMGDWAVDINGDIPQWTWRGKKVFVSQADELPQSAEVLRP